jgi:hypothetical protein
MIAKEFGEALRIELKTYDDLTEAIKKRKQRILHTNPDAESCHDETVIALTSIKSKTGRSIEHLLKEWPIWRDWLAHVPGVGPFVGGNMIMLYYYRHVAVCKKCGTELERRDGCDWCVTCEKTTIGDGLNTYRVEGRDFPTVSKWWAFMGRSVVDGKMPKRKKGVVSNWSSLGRLVGFHFSEQVNRQPPDNLYKKFLLDRKKKREGQVYPDGKPISKGHIHNMAKNETVKLFLSHFWHVARTIDGKPTHTIYAEGMLGHENIIAPYYWNEGPDHL